MLAAATPAKPSPTPSASSSSSVDAAQALKAAHAAQQRVAALTAKIKAQATQVGLLTTSASEAEQAYQDQLVVQANAQSAENATALATAAAVSSYRSASVVLSALAVTEYENGGGPGGIGAGSSAALLTSSDPGQLLDDLSAQQMVDTYQANVVVTMSQAMTVKKAAQARQQSALDVVSLATERLNAIEQDAMTALSSARTEMASIQTEMVTADATQTETAAVLSSFLGGWSTADPVEALALNTQYAALAKTVKAAPLVKPAGKWSAKVGQSVVDRAIQWIATPYAWDGGSSAGPTQGTCAGDGAQNDCHLVGFDCSGLAMYSWSPYLAMPHSAEAQYASGTIHPAPTALLPGDLVFWSSNGGVSGIHHVAIYVGNGNAIQAPQSGDIVRITPLGSVASGYFGATRPLT